LLARQEQPPLPYLRAVTIASIDVLSVTGRSAQVVSLALVLLVLRELVTVAQGSRRRAEAASPRPPPPGPARSARKDEEQRTSMCF
jgi:hypothetical protein